MCDGVVDGIKMFLSIPATSASSERVFSGAGFVFSERQRAMAAEGLSSHIFVRENSDNFEKTLEQVLNTHELVE